MAAHDIRYEYTGALAASVGPEHGLTEADLDGLRRETLAAAARLDNSRAATPYRDTWKHDDPARAHLAQLDKVLACAGATAGRFTDVVVLGIGGSALGMTCLRTALKGPFWNVLPPEQRRTADGRPLPRLWVIDNVDPDEFATLLNLVDPKTTLFNVISKSGGTAETVAQFVLALELVESCVGREGVADHVILTTDAEKGLLRPVVKALGLAWDFVVPDGVGGRFSVLTPVGLLPAALVGIDVRALLAGARAMDAACCSADFDVNLAAQGAAVQIGLWRKPRRKTMSVMMPYAAALKDVADWFRQLWAESLGKVCPGGELVGPTPIKALGVTDQHSQVQLYREGPNDKVFTILSVEQFASDLPLPPLPPSLKGVDYLKGHSMQELLKAEERATLWALAAVSGRPTTRLVVPKVTEQSVGALLYLLMVQTSIAGEMLRINTYNQPGVEAGKEATRALMGMTGDLKSPESKGLPAACKTYDTLKAMIEASGF